MRQFAEKVASILEELKDLETIAVKVASDTASKEAQVAQAQATNLLYGVIKEAAGSSREIPEFVDKLAKILGKPETSNEFKAKLAAATILDDTLCRQESTEKVASMTLYGREYVATLLKDVLT